MVPPSPNERKWQHHMARFRLRKAWQEGLFYGVICARHRRELIDQAKTNRMRVEITVHIKNTFDEDNLVAAMKPVLDGLKKLGYIRDDSPEFLELVLPIQQIKSAERKTVLKIGPVGNE